MSTEVSVDAVGRTLEALLVREGRPVVYQDRATGKELVVSPASAAAPDGLLPALVVAGEAVWREATGQGFALDVARDPAALLGYRLRAIRGGAFSTVMLSMMEAAAQAAQSGPIVVNELQAVWTVAVPPNPGPRPSPSLAGGFSP